MLLTDRNCNTTFLILLEEDTQYYFNIYFDSLVYILILPGFGINSQIIPTFAAKKNKY